MTRKNRSTKYNDTMYGIFNLLNEREYSSEELCLLFALSKQQIDCIVTFMTDRFKIYEYKDGGKVIYGVLK